MTSINRELLKGSLDVVLLHLLDGEPMYGYQIVKEVRQRSQGLLDLKEGSLYPALHRLEQSGLVESFWQRRKDGADRRYYRLTAAGREAASRKRAEWQQFTSIIQGVLSYA